MSNKESETNEIKYSTIFFYSFSSLPNSKRPINCSERILTKTSQSFCYFVFLRLQSRIKCRLRVTNVDDKISGGKNQPCNDIITSYSIEIISKVRERRVRWMEKKHCTLFYRVVMFSVFFFNLVVLFDLLCYQPHTVDPEENWEYNLNNAITTMQTDIAVPQPHNSKNSMRFVVCFTNNFLLLQHLGRSISPM